MIKRILILWLILGSLSVGFVLTINSRQKPKAAVPSCELSDINGHLNRGQCLPEGYVPEDLLPLSPRASWLNTEQRLNVRSKIMVEQLIADAEKDGMCLVVSSGYRSAEEQQSLLDKTENKLIVAKPNESEHQTGLAVDFVACPMEDGIRNDNVDRLELENDFEKLPEYKWLQDNASKYGFEQSYRIDNIQDTEYAVESWHWKLILN